MANLSLKHIYKVYPNGAKAVNDFNMTIDDKEFIVFVGPSGCGKSTTLRMIAGLEAITAGELKIDDVVVNGMEPKDRDIAMVFQNYALYPHMTIFENLAFGLRMRKIPDIKRNKKGEPVLDKHGEEIPIMRHYNKAELTEKVNEAAAILEITDYLKRKPKEMSGGQRQRVALGRAIVRKPKVMLLDEPLSNLDAKLRTQMRSEIVKLHKKLQTTFIYVTHDQVEAMTMGTRIVVMKDGYVKQIDTPKNLYKYPANKFVAGFIGTPQMNFFEGVLIKENQSVRIKFLDSNAEISVPYTMLMKTLPEYLDGQKKVYIGFRAESITLDEEQVKASTTKIKIRVSHSEELGTETLIYGNINLDSDDFSESRTRVIIKSAGFKDIQSDTIYEASLDVSGIHLFDFETEESIMPRIPRFNNLDCEVKDGNLCFLEEKLSLPKAIQCADGTGKLMIPTDAIKLSGDLKTKVIECECINDQYLISLEINGNRIYTLSNEPVHSKELKVSLDFKKLIIQIGSQEIQPMPEINGLDGTFIKEKKDKKIHYYLSIGGVQFEAPEFVYRKMFSATTGRKIYNSVFRYEWSCYDFKIADSGLEAQILDVLDYGEEKFLKCCVEDKILYVKTDKEYRGKIHLIPDVEHVSVIESERQIRIL